MRIVHCIRQKSPHKILGAKRLDETVGIAPEFNAAVLCVLYQLHEPVHSSKINKSSDCGIFERTSSILLPRGVPFVCGRAWRSTERIWRRRGVSVALFNLLSTMLRTLSRSSICHFTSSAERTRPIKGRNPDSTLAIDFVARKATFESSAFRQVSMIPSAFSRTVRATG